MALMGALVAVGAFVSPWAKPAVAHYCNEFSPEAVAELAELVIVGEVIDEQASSTTPRKSTIRVAAGLKGMPGREIRVSWSPRLTTGEHVLLFLGRPAWQVVGCGSGKYLLADGEAMTAAARPIAAEIALRRVAVITGASPDELNAALAFAQARDTSGPPVFLIGLASAGVAALLAALFGLRRLWRAR